MTFPGFTQNDFDVFNIPGLEARMAALIANVRPKLFQLGDLIQPALSAICGEEMFPHVAKHARRTVHPPNDTWVAWAHNKKGYKAHPHFQVGMFATHLFIQFAIIYESHNKLIFADHLQNHIEEIRRTIPGQYFWSLDHLSPASMRHQELSAQDFTGIAMRLRQIKKSEVICGLQLDRRDAVVSDGQRLTDVIEDTFKRIMPLYRMSF